MARNRLRGSIPLGPTLLLSIFSLWLVKSECIKKNLSFQVFGLSRKASKLNLARNSLQNF